MRSSVATIGRALAGLALAMGFASALWAQQVGTLSGTFLYDGKPPVQVAVPPAAVPAACGVILPAPPFVDAKGGVADVVVWLDVKASGKALPVMAIPPAKGAVVVANVGCVFAPRVAIVRTNQVVTFTNGDPSPHNVKGEPRDSEPFNILIPINGKLDVKITADQNLPVSTSCSIHPFMQGWLVVQDHPFVAVSDKQGKFSIPSLPVGDWTFVAWHENKGFVKEPKRGDATETWKRGRFTVSIKPGQNDVGQIHWAF